MQSSLEARGPIGLVRVSSLADEADRKRALEVREGCWQALYPGLKLDA